MRISDWSSDVCSSDLVAGIFSLLPTLAMLGAVVGGLYGLYLLYLGLPRLMKAPEDKAVVYTAVVVVVTILCVFLVSAIVGAFAMQGKIGSAACRERVCQYG